MSLNFSPSIVRAEGRVKRKKKKNARDARFAAAIVDRFFEGRKKWIVLGVELPASVCWRVRFSRVGGVFLCNLMFSMVAFQRYIPTSKSKEKDGFLRGEVKIDFLKNVKSFLSLLLV
jgi:hypothetical protein